MTDEDLRPFGWAPGGYTISCYECEAEGKNINERGEGAKGSWCCREHAVAKYEERELLMRDHVLFNMNEAVLLKLNDTGIEILRARHAELAAVIPSVGQFKPPVTDEHGYSRMQLWEAMMIFGPHITLSRLPPFDTQILIPKDRT